MTMPGHWTDRLSDYLDRELTAAEVAEADQHLMHCAECRDTLAELREVRARARQLAPALPDADLWPAIAAAIGSEAVVRRADVTPLRTRRRYAFSFPQLAAAGIALAAVSGTGVWLASGGGDRLPAVVRVETATPDAPLPDGDVTVRTASLRATATYDAAIGDLEAVLESGRTQLDPATVEVLETNLALIDSAIAEAQRAIAGDPANAYLNSHLARTMQRKLDLLRRAATLATTRS
ncbi:MAG TPA: zf-HC2 domain-containing protein [Gemmatimonadales bacterium]|nr:zf-HC2 domain-containing protein [Gemmatimonadales bacterium]